MLQFNPSTRSNQSLFFINNESQFSKLLTFIDFSEGLTIGFIEVDSNQERDWIIEALIKHPRCQDIQFVVLNFDAPEIRFLLDEILKSFSENTLVKDKKPVLIIKGLENSIGLDEYPPILQNLNFVRDAFSHQVPYPILFCLPSSTTTRFAKFAPDFWAWKSGIFKFRSLPEAERSQIAFPTLSLEYIQDDPLPESQSRINLLERLLQEYSENQSEKNLQTVVSILDQLGGAYLSRKEWEKAENVLLEALKLSEQQESLQVAQASLLQKLGDLYRKKNMGKGQKI